MTFQHSSGPAIEADGLRKRFGTLRALDGVGFPVERGTTLGLLGPNGSGKSTTVRALTTLLRPDAGTGRVNGIDVLREPERARTQFGLAGQYASVDELLRGRNNLILIGQPYQMPARDARRRADVLLERFDLVEAAGRLAGTYSGSMRRRLDLAASLMATPPVLFLDEPTTGLDPRSRLAIWDVISGLVSDGTTVLLTTQYLEEADRLADRIVVMDRGRVIADATPQGLKRSVGGETLTEVMRVLAGREIALEDIAIHRPTLFQVLKTMVGVIGMVNCAAISGWGIHTDPLQAAAGFGLITLFALATNFIGVCIGISVSNARMADQVTMSVSMPMTFLANTFIAVETLPNWLKPVANWNLVSATVTAVRQLFGNDVATSQAWPLAHPFVTSIGACLLIIAVTLILSVRAWSRQE